MIYTSISSKERRLRVWAANNAFTLVFLSGMFFLTLVLAIIDNYV